MLRKYKFIGKVILLMLILAFSDGEPTIKKDTRVVVIDAGHGGKDSGAIGKHGKEKDIVLAIALKVGHYLQENLDNVKVLYTRTDDTFVELHKRAEIANSNHADLFISIHVNSNKNPSPYGTETYAMGLHKTKGNLEVAKKENSVIMIEEDYTTKYEGFDPGSTESYIIFSLLQNVNLEQSLDLASHVQTQFESRARRYNRGVKQAGFIVLWKTTMPSVLIEAGFISNPEEEEYLLSETGQDYLASAIYRAVKDYLEIQESIDLTEETLTLQNNINDSVEKINHDAKVLFRIQVASSSNSIKENTEYFGGFPVKEHKIDNLYKYTVFESPVYDSIQNDLISVRTKFPDAFIVAFENEEKITLQEALEKIKNNTQ